MNNNKFSINKIQGSDSISDLNNDFHVGYISLIQDLKALWDFLYYHKYFCLRKYYHQIINLYTLI